MIHSLVILAHGDFPSSPAALAALDNADCVICCDGAAELLLAHGRTPDFITGDMDSLPDRLKERFADIIRPSSCQETNDQTKAFRLALTLNPERITILGATGAREDHTMGNVSLLLDYVREASCPVSILTDYGRFEAILDSATLPCRRGQEISIFAFDNTLRIKSVGLEYPTDNVVFDSLWKATLNVAAADTFTLTLSHPAGVLVYFAE
ncbi:MAG: thiamine diphosphokinase [Bacteroidales bacterium]|nr:thiamine diphosphokinase [Bacteroidales bacterium]